MNAVRSTHHRPGNTLAAIDTPPAPPLADAFLAGMRRLASGVSVVAVEHNRQLFALTATAVCSLSADPPSVVVCVNRGSEAYAAIGDSRRVSVNVLADGQAGIAHRCAGMDGRRGAARFEGADWRLRPGHPPMLADALAAFQCRVAQETPFGSHAILACEVEEVLLSPGGAPLLYANRGYASLGAAIDPLALPERRAAG